ncbi:MAG: FAD-dependent oxidoreductase [Pseudomonadota bacterium]
MLIDPAGCPDALSAQVAIVGAGPVGMAAALDLARAGVDTVLVSAGGRDADPEQDALAAAEACPEDHADPARLGARRLGGLSWSWGGRCVALEPADFLARPELGLPGWPIERDALMSRAADAARFLGIGEPQFTEPDITAPDAVGAQLLALERWSAQPQLLRQHRSALEDPRGPRVLLSATCTGARFDGDRVGSLALSLPNGKRVGLKADAYVIASGGVETARLLLWFFAENGREAPYWLGRGYMGHLKGQIADIALSTAALPVFDYRRDGDCFVRARLPLPEDLRKDAGLPNISFHIDNLPLFDPAHGSAGLSAVALPLLTPGLNSILIPKAMREFLMAEYPGPAALAGHLRNVARAPVSSAAFLWATARARFGHPVRPGFLEGGKSGRFALTFNGEQRPERENRVRLGETTDRFGVPRAIIEKSVAEDEIDAVIEAHRSLATYLAARGIGHVTFRPIIDRAATIRRASADGYHQIGLARMSDASGGGVVDANARLHGMRNLYVAGAATFPRSGHANPTFSAVCQSLRLSGTLSH